MIWHNGLIVDPGQVRVDLNDRIFEHGLGLFETLRTYNGCASLLPKHLARLEAACRDLGLPHNGVRKPNQADVSALIQACDLKEALLRITMTGGTPDGEPPILWMTAKPLPALTSGPIDVVVHPVLVATIDPLAGYKSINYWARRLAFQASDSRGAADCLLCGPNGEVWEGSRHNVLIVPNGRGNTIATPPLTGPVLPGIMRSIVLDFARNAGYSVEERIVFLDELRAAEAVFLTNSVRGVRRVRMIDDKCLSLDLHQELTRSFQDLMLRELEQS